MDRRKASFPEVKLRKLRVSRTLLRVWPRACNFANNRRYQRALVTLPDGSDVGKFRLGSAEGGSIALHHSRHPGLVPGSTSPKSLSSVGLRWTLEQGSPELVEGSGLTKGKGQDLLQSLPRAQV